MDRLTAIDYAAGAYLASPAPGVQRITWQDVTADIFEVVSDQILGIAVQGTNPEKLANLARDADVKNDAVINHPRCGPLFEGALNAAEGLLPLILAVAGEHSLLPLGHSLGGQIAVDLAGLVTDQWPTRITEFWGFDPPKSGYAPLATLLTPVTGTIFRFNGSIVTRWPFDEGVHVKPPELIGDYSPLWLTAHSIVRAASWVRMHDTPPVPRLTLVT